jgi:hypothetical protein
MKMYSRPREAPAGAISKELVSLGKRRKQGIEMHWLVFRRSRCRWDKGGA